MNIAYKIMFFVSLLLIAAATFVILVFGLRFGVDFKGGSVLEVDFVKERPAPAELTKIIGEISGVKSVSVNPFAEQGMLVRMNEISEETHQEVLKTVGQKYGQIIEKRFDSVGPTVGNELKKKSVTAIIILLLAVAVYIAFVFRAMAKVLSPWALSAATIIALIHDVLVPIGVFALLGYYFGVEINGIFLAAVLTILGYSVSDSVVVFDRVRENVLRFGSREEFGALVHRSVMQTLSRSLNTTFTTLLSLIAIYFFGGDSVKYFALALIIGIFLGAYSSIFIASPILVWWSGKPRN
jgi:preprotein translocase subunit SecF